MLEGKIPVFCKKDHTDEATNRKTKLINILNTRTFEDDVRGLIRPTLKESKQAEKTFKKTLIKNIGERTFMISGLIASGDDLICTDHLCSVYFGLHTILPDLTSERPVNINNTESMSDEAAVVVKDAELACRYVSALNSIGSDELDLMMDEAFSDTAEPSPDEANNIFEKIKQADGRLYFGFVDGDSLMVCANNVVVTNGTESPMPHNLGDTVGYIVNWSNVNYMRFIDD